MRPGRRGRGPRGVDLTSAVGSVTLPNPVMTASGTAGHGAELAPYLDLAGARRRGGEVAARRAVARQPAAAGARDGGGDDQLRRPPGPRRRRLAGGRPAGPRRHRRPGRGVDLGPHGRGVRQGRRAAGRRPARRSWRSRSTCRAPTPRRGATCSPTTPGPRRRPSTPPGGARRPLWAKLSPNTSDLDAIAAAAHDAGAEAVTLVNTVMGMAIDPETRRFRLGAGAPGRRAVGAGDPPGRGAGGVRRAPGAARPAHRRRRGRGRGRSTPPS